MHSVVRALVAVVVLMAPAVAVQAAPEERIIVLPGANSTEGIAVGDGSTFFAGELLSGDIFRGNLRDGTVERFIDAPAGRMAVGMKVDTRNNLLFVAGGMTGQAFVYDTTTGGTVATVQLAEPGAATFINDVTSTRDGAWFTDSRQAKLYFVPVQPSGAIGAVRTLNLTGPASDASDPFNLNGIAATPDAKTLLVAHSGNEAVYTVDATTGASSQIAGVRVPAADGILLEAGRLWVVQNRLNQIAEIRLSSDLTSGTVEKLITSPSFQTPTTVARHGDQLAVVNAKFDTGNPPTASQYEVVVVER
jgi:sugar lactone lactonase YvrE